MSHITEALERAHQEQPAGRLVIRPATSNGTSRKHVPNGVFDTRDFDLFRSEARFGGVAPTPVESQAVGEIGAILSRIADPALRAQVLREATELYASSTARASMPSMIDSFVRDFQQLVRDWNDAEAEPA